MSYYNQNQPPIGVPPSQGYGYPPGGYPPPGYPPGGYPPPGYPPYPPPQYPPPPPQNQSIGDGLLARIFCCCLMNYYCC